MVAAPRAGLQAFVFQPFKLDRLRGRGLGVLIFASLGGVCHGTEDDGRAVSPGVVVGRSKALTTEGAELHRGKLGRFIYDATEFLSPSVWTWLREGSLRRGERAETTRHRLRTEGWRACRCA